MLVPDFDLLIVDFITFGELSPGDWFRITYDDDGAFYLKINKEESFSNKSLSCIYLTNDIDVIKYGAAQLDCNYPS